MKKMLSMIMAIAMVASLAVTAFATSTSDSYVGVANGNPGASTSANVTDANKAFTSTVKSKVKAPTIKVTIPTTNNVYLNPYKMTVNVAGTDKSDEIVGVPTVIKSASDCKLAFSAVVTGKASTGVTLEKASVKDSNGNDTKKTNSVYMFVYFGQATDKTDPTAAAGLAAPGASDLVFTATNDTPANAIVVGTTASKSTKVLTLEAGDTTAQYGAFVIGGDIVAAPDTPWTEKHTVDVTVALSIAPVQASTT